MGNQRMSNGRPRPVAPPGGVPDLGAVAEQQAQQEAAQAELVAALASWKEPLPERGVVVIYGDEHKWTEQAPGLRWQVQDSGMLIVMRQATPDEIDEYPQPFAVVASFAPGKWSLAQFIDGLPKPSKIVKHPALHPSTSIPSPSTV